MPSWKKVLISGSDAALNTLNVSTALTASGLNYPTVDGTAGQAIVTDGSGSLSFTSIVSGIGSTTKYYQSLAAMTWSFAHNLNEQYPVVTIYDSNDEVIIPEKIDAVDANNLAIYFSTARIGRAVAVVGGTTVSASLSQTASYVEYDNVVNKPTLISGSEQIASDISGSFTSLSSSIAGDIEDIIDGTTTVTSASHAEYAESSSFATIFNISNELTASGLNYPTVDGTVGQVFTTDGLGNITLASVDNTRITIKNISGGEIIKGTPLYLTGSGTSGNIVGVFPADAGNPARMPAGAIAGETLADEAEGVGLINGYIGGVNTSDFNSGDQVYVAVGGGYTNIPPTGSVGGNIVQIQKLGNVEKVSPTNGSGVINGPGAARSVPNIEPGYTWVGNSDYVATAVSTASLFVTSGSHALNADDAISASYSLTSSYVNPLAQNVDITGDLTVTGTVTAQEFHTELVSSSIIYESGSTKFGDTADDTHQFTGSVSVDGDIYVSSSKSYYLGPNSYLRRETNSGGFESVQLNGSVFLKPNTSANASNGVVIGGNGYLLAPNSSRNAQLNYGSVSGQFGVYRLNVYGGDAAFQHDVNISGSIEVTGSAQVYGTLGIKSANVSYQENTDVDFGAAEVVATVSSTLYTAAFFDYVVAQGTNLRAGTVTAVHDGTNVEYTEVATQDLGSTTGLTFTCDLSGGNIRLLATSIDDNWSIKTLVRAL